jgi:hypothetical protein
LVTADMAAGPGLIKRVLQKFVFQFHALGSARFPKTSQAVRVLK